MIDIEQCSGCCTGPREEVYMFESHPLWLPWTSNSQGSHELRLDGELAKFDLYSGQEIALGDYSDSSGRNFKRCGNIFEDMQKHGIDSTDSVYHPVVSCVSSCKSVSRRRRMRTQNEVAVTSPVEDTFEREGVEHATKPLALYQPKGRSLPDTEDFELLLKALSTRLAGKCLVTTVIECSKFNTVDDEETRVDVGGDSALDGGVRSVDQGVLIPLCIVASPLAWNKEPPYEERRIIFKNIRQSDRREHFYASANLHKRKTNGGVDFPTLFGLEHLKHYIGKITFFQRLSSIVETQLRSEVSAGTTGGNELSAHPSNPLFVGLTVARNLLKSSLRSDAGKNSRNEVEAPLLLRKCEALQRKLSDETKNTRSEVESISQTLSVGLLEYVRTSFLNASEDNK
ncbi:hypothetical protein EV401DRAFT_2037458 [Pisolithus croceorrhizus]|nr:hypothetical protein EV401DRAFT_2037458 [Pisolithus croceorrhizus]